MAKAGRSAGKAKGLLKGRNPLGGLFGRGSESLERYLKKHPGLLGQKPAAAQALAKAMRAEAKAAIVPERAALKEIPHTPADRAEAEKLAHTTADVAHAKADAGKPDAHAKPGEDTKPKDAHADASTGDDAEKKKRKTAEKDEGPEEEGKGKKKEKTAKSEEKEEKESGHYSGYARHKEAELAFEFPEARPAHIRNTGEARPGEGRELADGGRPKPDGARPTEGRPTEVADGRPTHPHDGRPLLGLVSLALAADGATPHRGAPGDTHSVRPVAKPNGHALG